jgi:hypothetical protein
VAGHARPRLPASVASEKRAQDRAWWARRLCLTGIVERSLVSGLISFPPPKSRQGINSLTLVWASKGFQRASGGDGEQSGCQQLLPRLGA